MIAIIDYQAGNPHSVWNALKYLGYKATLVNQPNHLEGKKLIILPGVGSADATRKSLAKLGFWEALPDIILHQKTPFLGICVGLQILFEHSEEGDTECLGWLPGHVKRFNSNQVRVPQMGWNSLEFNSQHPLYKKLHTKNTSYFYFVNSFYAIPSNSGDILGTTDYDGRFCSMINHDHIFATQFHIEKSSLDGLLLLKKILDHLVILPNVESALI